MFRQGNNNMSVAFVTFFLGVIGTAWYFKFRGYKRGEDDELYSTDLEVCDQSAFDGSERVAEDVEVGEDDKVIETVEDVFEEEPTYEMYHINEEMRTSQEWYHNDKNVNIKQPDGWRDADDPKSFWNKVAISKENYIIRRSLSTLSFNSKGDKNDPFPDDDDELL